MTQRSFVREIELENLAIFRNDRFNFSDGINILIGKNSTGKTILMKLIYCMLSTLKQAGSNMKKADLEVYLKDKLKGVFLIERVGRLVTRGVGVKRSSVKLRFEPEGLYSFSFSTLGDSVKIEDYISEARIGNPIYIPPKEILSLMDRGIIGSLEKTLLMEEVYLDLAKKLDTPLERGAYDRETKALLKKFKMESLEKISRKNKEFFVYMKNIGNLESKLLAEGYRKISTIIYLIKNGELTNGSYLFWDEPEANLNPALSELVVELLIFLAKELKVQVFVSTHDYFIMKWFHMRHIAMKDKVSLKFFVLQAEDGKVSTTESEDFYALENNPILEEFEKVLEEDIKLSSKHE